MVEQRSHTAKGVGSIPTFTTKSIMNKLIINGCTLVMTCLASPEQYDVFFGDFQLGYLHLRRSMFTASYPDYNGITVYHGYPKGDGCFDDDERFFFLKEAVDSLLALHNTKVLETLYYERD